MLLVHSVICAEQWRTQKIFMGVSFSDICWRFVFGVRCLWRHNLTSYSCFQAKFVDIIGIFFYTHSPYLCKKSSLIHFPLKFCKISSASGGVLTLNPPLAYALGADNRGNSSRAAYFIFLHISKALKTTSFFLI